MFRKAGDGLPEAAAGVVAAPEWEVAAPATAAPPNAAPVRAATPSPTFLILSSIVRSFRRGREPRCGRRVGACLGVGRNVLRMGSRHFPRRFTETRAKVRVMNEADGSGKIL